ncbi:Alpha/Beta hydrolase protein [Hygrophoropsis aurantiaca]|uniref:Alpha/Beta hydrolase protein n=1 Tax=Hygrophoropsis aurantiaca TaxID=72124 RepID=A0ACB8AMC9_9AGAM|nr:Alpha/Beta hydrolase protein [Hygrophoropsis aurantiaca]
MTVSTFSSAVHITPTVIKTFLTHSRRKAKKFKNSQSEDSFDNIFFDEAFHIVKSFIFLGTENTVESLQAFTNTHVPAPFWATVVSVLIPFFSCNRAADALIKWFGPEDLNLVVGGERWWQVRGLDGIDAEWIAEKSQLPSDDTCKGRRLSEEEKNIMRMEELETVMFYVHGGGYFWGSINTHRYQIIRYARKIGGRAFAVNYRKAPQYPWPCPLQDVLAAYLYLIDPPPGAFHKAVSPSKIVFAGDSAGGALAFTVLTILRDLQMPMPAGAVLISPWVDLTHSFPSIMTNTDTDIIPPHGFLSKPSTLWPIDLINEDSRVVPTQTNPPPLPGHADKLWPNGDSTRNQRADNSSQLGTNRAPKSQKEMVSFEFVGDDIATDNPEQLDEDTLGHGRIGKRRQESPGDKNGSDEAIANGRGPESDNTIPDFDDLEFWQPKPPKVLMNDPTDVPLELRSQIQLYATTEQLSHPLVSPVLQGSLGNLCPLYILAGDGEVLRDEVVYLAHRAAFPKEYPVREGVIRDGWRQKENVQKFTSPTKVHLQVFDGMCHVLTVFTFTESAEFAYNSIAEFAKHVTQNSLEHLERHPFPESRQSSSNTSIYCHHSQCKPAKDYGDHNHDVSDVSMVRERVDIHGQTRPMEPKGQVAALCLKPSEIGIIKEDPLYKWLHGQMEWDRRFRRTARTALKKRRKQETKARFMIQHARAQGLLMENERTNIQRYPDIDPTVIRTSGRVTNGMVQEDRRWGPFDLAGERPPPTALAGRRDTPEALALIKKNIYHTAPITHKTIPKMKTFDVVQAAFDPHDDPFRPPQQSASEEQVRSGIRQMHGLRVWESLLSYFVRKSSAKAMDGTRRAGNNLVKAGNKAANSVVPKSEESRM